MEIKSEIRPENTQAWTGFEPMTSAIPVQYSTNWANWELIIMLVRAKNKMRSTNTSKYSLILMIQKYRPSNEWDFLDFSKTPKSTAKYFSESDQSKHNALLLRN